MMGLGMLRAGSALVALSVLLMALFAGAAQAREPIKIGFSVSLTGGLASAGKAHLLQTNLGRRNQRQGRIAGPSSQARVL
jgi:hypothetical protein